MAGVDNDSDREEEQDDNDNDGMLIPSCSLQPHKLITTIIDETTQKVLLPTRLAVRLMCHGQLTTTQILNLVIYSLGFTSRHNCMGHQALDRAFQALVGI